MRVCCWCFASVAVAAGVVVDMVVLGTNKELLITQEQPIYTQITCLLVMCVFSLWSRCAFVVLCVLELLLSVCVMWLLLLLLVS